MQVQDIIPECAECTYTASYCEENVWKLCAMVKERCSENELAKCFCVFISNESKKIPLWHQKSSKNESRLIIWDYHVILLYQNESGCLVYDLDTELEFPCLLKEYATVCIGDESILKEEYRRLFRVIPASEYLTTFASNRSHMLNEKGGWLAPPPPYPPIQCQDTSNNLDEFISMDKSMDHGQVFTLQEFLHNFNIKL